MMTLQVRWFAGAAEAAGTASSTVQWRDGMTVSEALAEAAGGNERAVRAVGVASLLLDARLVTDRATPVPAEARTLDVLPPFAGG